MPESGRTHIIKDMDSLEAIYGAPASTSFAKEIDYIHPITGPSSKPRPLWRWRHRARAGEKDNVLRLNG